MALWMISYRYEACYRTERGISRNAPMDYVLFTDKHPARFVADAFMELCALEDAPYAPEKGVQSATDIIRVYSAFEVPDEALTEEQTAAVASDL